MRKSLLAAGIAAAAFLPSMAFAQAACDPQRSVTTAGAMIGAMIDAAAGRDPNCAHAYGYYDSRGMWHASAVARTDARGYYDRDGRWVVGAPNGYYDAQGRWMAASSSPSASGYYDARGRWIPASAGGYYDVDGQWVAASASGYYDRKGRWVAGPVVGRYDQDGRWTSGQPSGHRDANGVWVADAQPGYYDSDGRWRAGQVVGYYDTQGRWIGTGVSVGGGRGYGQGQGMWDGAPGDIRSRQTWLEQRIRTGMSQGTLARAEGARALRTLSEIKRQEKAMRHYRGRLDPRNETIIQAKLDNLNGGLRWSRGG